MDNTTVDKNNKQPKMKNKLQWSLILISIVPVLIAGVVFTFFSISILTTSNADNVYRELNGVCRQTENEFSKLYPRGYSVLSGQYFSEGRNISDFADTLERFKKHFDVEVTIFFGEERALTTIVDDDGKRFVGTTQNDKRIIDSVFNGGVWESNDVIIQGNRYYGVYIPLYDGDEVGGMVFAGLTQESFQDSINSFYFKITLFMLAIVFVIGTIVILYTNKITVMLGSIKDYLGKLVLRQTPDIEMDEAVLERSDEIGDLGRYAVDVGEQLKSIIGCDPLTGLYNRRAGRQLLDCMWEKSDETGKSFTIVMGDIDFFKRVNDTYGHDEGDEVLKTVAAIMKKHIAAVDDSFAIRWGGEEFMMGFMLSKNETVSLLKKMSDEIKSVIFKTKIARFKISMTFGVAERLEKDAIHNMIVRSDENLYKGKQDGRDRIVS